MQVPDELRECVVFLHSKDGDKYIARGTAFFIGIAAASDPDVFHIQLVTSKHVIDNIGSLPKDQKVYIRVNLVDGGFDWIDSDVRQWVPHPDPTQCVDVAVLPWAPPQSVIRYKFIPSTLLVTDAILKSESIGVGDEIFTTGLFVNRLGEKRNIPIVRTGNIAAMPEEPIKTPIGSMEAYLSESRSVGGLSGSPVFVSLGPIRISANGGTSIGSRRFQLLGLMQGHWDAKLSSEDSPYDFTKPEIVNMGIAIVIPSQKILETLNHPLLVAFRDAYAAMTDEQKDAVMKVMTQAKKTPIIAPLMPTE